MVEERSRRRSGGSRCWRWPPPVVAVAVVAMMMVMISSVVISCVFSFDTKSPAADEPSSFVAQEREQQMQRRRLAAAAEDANTNNNLNNNSPTAPQMSTISITSKFNEKRSFLDPSWKEWGDALVQFETLVSPSELDFTISRRLPWEQDDSPDKCDDILLLMPEYFARNGHGSQLNSYLLAAMMATFLGKAMLILDAPQKNTKYPNGSMVSSFGRSSLQINNGFLLL